MGENPTASRTTWCLTLHRLCWQVKRTRPGNDYDNSMEPVCAIKVRRCWSGNGHVKALKKIEENADLWHNLVPDTATVRAWYRKEFWGSKRALRFHTASSPPSWRYCNLLLWTRARQNVNLAGKQGVAKHSTELRKCADSWDGRRTIQTVMRLIKKREKSYFRICLNIFEKYEKYASISVGCMLLYHYTVCWSG